MTISYETQPWLLPLSEEDFESNFNEKLNGKIIQKVASCKLNSTQSKKIVKKVAGLTEIDGFQTIKLGLLSDCNLNFYSDDLIISGLRCGLLIKPLVVEYSNIIDQVGNPTSELYEFRPDFIIYASFGMLFNNLVAEFSENRSIVKEAVNQVRDEIRIVDRLTKKYGDAQLLVQTIPNIFPDVFGNIDRKQQGAFGSEVLNLNNYILESDYRVIDIEKISQRIGYYNWFDEGKYHWAKLPFSPRYSGIYCDTVMRNISVFKGQGKKCLILDLDNTLWGGVIGDDGVEGIKLGNNSPLGEAFLAGQRYYKSLANRGVILAVCSKNDLSNALLPFEKHPEMILKTSDIACFIANWKDKPSNIRHISSVLGLGLDSFVFLDDNPMERDHVRHELPSVVVPEVFGDEPSTFPRTLEYYGLFDSIDFTTTDQNRVKDYKANVKRKDLEEESNDIDDYLKALKMHFSFNYFSKVDESRIVQLINRSNQFNLTTKRYTGAEISKLYTSNKKTGFSGRLKDKFSDTGIVTLLICEERLEEEKILWEIDTWVMSCRVLGRKTEHIMLQCLIQAANQSNVDFLIGKYIPTNKNSLVKNLYCSLGFSKVSSTHFSIIDPGDEGTTLWALDIKALMQEQFAIDNLPFNLSFLKEAKTA